MTGPTRLRTGTGTAIAAIALLGLLSACGSSGGDKASSGASTTKAPAGSTTTSSSAPTGATTTPAGETTTTLTSEGTDTETTQLDTLPDGDHHGYIAGLENGEVEGQKVQVLIWDEVELLTGQEAIAAAAEDGVTLDTDFYIRNQDQTVKRIAVVPEASVTTLEEGGSGSVPSSVDEVWRQQHLFKINVGNVRGITTISGIDAVYLP